LLISCAISEERYSKDTAHFQPKQLTSDTITTPTTHTTEISTLTSCGQCYAPKRPTDPTDPTDTSPPTFGLSFRSASVLHCQGRISSAKDMQVDRCKTGNTSQRYVHCE
jgi:hypothetical protein